MSGPVGYETMQRAAGKSFLVRHSGASSPDTFPIEHIDNETVQDVDMDEILTITPHSVDDTLRNTQKGQFLRWFPHILDLFAEPVVGIDDMRQLTFIQRKKEVHLLFLYGKNEFFEGDLITLEQAERSAECPISYTYFKALWREHYPQVICENDKPNVPSAKTVSWS